MTIAAGNEYPRGQHCSALTLAMSMTKSSVTTGCGRYASLDAHFPPLGDARLS